MPTLNTRIKLKYDTLANWSTANPVLLAGEVAVVAIPTESESTVGQVTKPAIVFKVGDGTTEFNTLPYASGLAADVYSWAKAATKPSYTAGEVGADAAGTAAGLIGELDVTDSAVGGQYVSAVSQVDGKIQVTRASLPTVNIPEYTLQAGDEEGTIELLKDGAVVGTAIEVTGWTELVAEVAAKYVKPVIIPKRTECLLFAFNAKNNGIKAKKTVKESPKPAVDNIKSKADKRESKTCPYHLLIKLYINSLFIK